MNTIENTNAEFQGTSEPQLYSYESPEASLPSLLEILLALQDASLSIPPPELTLAHHNDLFHTQIGLNNNNLGGGDEEEEIDIITKSFSFPMLPRFCSELELELELESVPQSSTDASLPSNVKHVSASAHTLIEEKPIEKKDRYANGIEKKRRARVSFAPKTKGGKEEMEEREREDVVDVMMQNVAEGVDNANTPYMLQKQKRKKKNQQKKKRSSVAVEMEMAAAEEEEEEQEEEAVEVQVHPVTNDATAFSTPFLLEHEKHKRKKQWKRRFLEAEAMAAPGEEETSAEEKKEKEQHQNNIGDTHTEVLLIEEQFQVIEWDQELEAAAFELQNALQQARMMLPIPVPAAGLLAMASMALQNDTFGHNNNNNSGNNSTICTNVCVLKCLRIAATLIPAMAAEISRLEQLVEEKTVTVVPNIDNATWPTAIAPATAAADFETTGIVWPYAEEIISMQYESGLISLQENAAVRQLEQQRQQLLEVSNNFPAYQRNQNEDPMDALNLMLGIQ